MLGFCMRCKEKVEFEPTETKEYNTKKGIKYGKLGNCPVCKTKMVVMVRKE